MSALLKAMDLAAQGSELKAVLQGTPQLGLHERR